MKILYYLVLTCTLLSTAISAMEQNTVNTEAVPECFVCEDRPGTIDTRTIFACLEAHTVFLCEPCSLRFRFTQQQVEYHGPREWVCPICRAAKIDIAQAQAPRPAQPAPQPVLAPRQAPRPAAPQHVPQPQQPAAQPAHHFHHNGADQGDVRMGVTREGKAILLMAAIGTIYFTAKYIYNRFKAQEKPLDNTDNFSDFGFDDTCPAAISDSDIDAFASSSNQSEVLDEDWFN